MIILLASYPRSGNTFFRMIANVVFGLKSADVYSKDGFDCDSEAVKKLSEFAGWIKLSEAGTAGVPSLLKTHEPVDASDDRPAICVLRDGRDAYVSYAHFAMSFFPDQMPSTEYLEVLRMLVQSTDHFAGWSGHVEGWLSRKAPTAFVRYEDLVARPVESAMEALQTLGASVRSTGDRIPDMNGLHELMPNFFRKGRVGSWREEMPADIEELFWQHHGATMTKLGYPR